MLIRRSIGVARHIIMYGVALVIGVDIALAGEKIRFSDQPENGTTPIKRPKEEFSRPFDLKGGGDGAEPASLPPPASTNVRDPKVEEFMDQKKNWIFNTPSKANDDRALKEMFKIREYKSDEFDGGKKRKSAIDRYFEQAAEDRKEISTKFNSRNKDADSGAEEGSESSHILGLPLEQGNRSSLSPVSEMNVNTFGRKGSEFGSPISAAPGDLSPRNFNSEDVLGLPRRGSGSGPTQFFGQDQREQRLQEFQKNLGATPAIPNLWRDPINLRTDGTRQAINPIVAAPSPGLGGGLDSGLTSVGGLSGAGPRSPISDLINSRALGGGSSLSPAVITPSAATFLQRTPAVLEIPRRKF